MKSILVAGCLIFTMTCLADQNGVSISDKSNGGFAAVDTAKFNRLLRKQISMGGYPENWNSSMAGEEDLALCMAIEDSILRSNGYRKTESFNRKMKEIFQLVPSRLARDPVRISLGIDNNYYKKNCSEPPDRFRLALFPSVVVFASYKYQLITHLLLVPQLLDYKKQYPWLAEFERHTDFRTDDNEPKVKWMNTEGADSMRNQFVQVTIARNKYLFNDDRNQLDYLLKYDERFMHALVEIFGYTKDEKLLDAVLKKYKAKSTDDYVPYTLPAYYDRKLGRIIFSKNCNNELVVRKGILDYIEKNANENDLALTFMLRDFGWSLYWGENDATHNVYTKNQRRTIIAYISNVYDPIFRKYRESVNLNWSKVPPIAAFLRKDPGMEEFCKSHGYFNLPHLKEMIEWSKTYFLDDFLYK